MAIESAAIFLTLQEHHAKCSLWLSITFRLFLDARLTEKES